MLISYSYTKTAFDNFFWYQVDEAKKNLFITIVGSEVYNIMMSLKGPDLPSKHQFEDLMKLLGAYFTPRLNKSSERAKFNRIMKQEGDSIKEFPSDELLLKCLEDQLTDQFLIGLKSEIIRNAIINTDSANFQTCF